MIIDGMPINDKYMFKKYFNILEILANIPDALAEIYKFYVEDKNAEPYIEEIVKLECFLKNSDKAKVELKPSQDELSDFTVNLWRHYSEEATEKFQRLLTNNESTIRNIFSSCENKYTQTLFLIGLFLCGLVDYDGQFEEKSIINALIHENTTLEEELVDCVTIYEETSLPAYKNVLNGKINLTPVQIINVGVNSYKVSIDTPSQMLDCVFLKPQECIYAMRSSKGYLYFIRKSFGVDNSLCDIVDHNVSTRHKIYCLSEVPVSCSYLNMYGLVYNDVNGKINQVNSEKEQKKRFPEISEKVVYIDSIGEIYCLLYEDGTTKSNFPALVKTNILRILPGTGNVAFIHDDFSVSFMSGDSPEGEYKCMAVISFFETTVWLGINMQGELLSNTLIPASLVKTSVMPVYVKANGFTFSVNYNDGSVSEYPIEL